MHLLTGATGYVGGRLLRRLERDGSPVRCLCRNPEALSWRVTPDTEVVQGDLLQPESLVDSFCGVDTAFYLVHSMQERARVRSQGAQGRWEFAGRRAKRECGALSTWADWRTAPSSRLTCAAVPKRANLRSSGIPVIEFQASIVIGSGSASFEMIRALVERLPVMITPRWVNTAAQPIANRGRDRVSDGRRSLPSKATSPLKSAERRQIVRRDHARIRPPAKIASMDPARAVPQSVAVEPMVDTDHSRVRIDRTLPDRKCPQSERGSESERSRIVRHPANGDHSGNRASLNATKIAGRRRPVVRAPRGRQSGSCAPELGTRSSRQRADRASAAVGPEQAFAPIRRIGGPNGWYFGNACGEFAG